MAAVRHRQTAFFPPPLFEGESRERASRMLSCLHRRRGRSSAGAFLIEAAVFRGRNYQTKPTNPYESSAFIFCGGRFPGSSQNTCSFLATPQTTKTNPLRAFASSGSAARRRTSDTTLCGHENAKTNPPQDLDLQKRTQKVPTNSEVFQRTARFDAWHGWRGLPPAPESLQLYQISK
jgi:hypothetical protein